jgi:putative transcriptional regulator
MAKRRITAKSLSEELDCHISSVLRLRKQDVLPEVGGDRVEEIRVAIDKLSAPSFGPCQLGELIELDGKADRLPETRGGRRVKQEEEVLDRA